MSSKREEEKRQDTKKKIVKKSQSITSIIPQTRKKQKIFPKRNTKKIMIKNKIIFQMVSSHL